MRREARGFLALKKLYRRDYTELRHAFWNCPHVINSLWISNHGCFYVDIYVYNHGKNFLSQKIMIFTEFSLTLS